jgi:putative ABC transport system permease protein
VGSKREDTKRGISGADLRDWREQSRTFEDIDAFLPNLAFSLAGQETDRVRRPALDIGSCRMLGVQPAIGRNFAEEEARFGANPVVLLSEALWRTRFNSDRTVLGRAILLDGRPYAVIGVTPAGFFFPDTDARLWIPAPCGFSDFERRGAVSLNAVGRMRPNVALIEAQADLDIINSRLARAYPETNRQVTTGVFPLRYIVIGKYERALWTLLWAVGVVLLIACANVVHLQLARGVERETELAVRAASARPGVGCCASC